MKKLHFFLLFLLLINKLFAQSEKGIDIADLEKKNFQFLSKTSEINYPGDPSFDVTYYKLDLNVFYSPRQIIGNVQINGKVMTDSINKIFINLSNNMKVDSILSQNSLLEFTHLDNKIDINFKNYYQKNEEFSLIIFYNGTPRFSGLGSFSFDSHNGFPSIWTLSEPYGAPEWWPCKDDPGDKADSADIWVTCDDILIPVSNGKLADIIYHPANKHTYKWESRYPIANYLISLTISNFSLYQQYFKYSESDSMPVVHYVYPEDLESVKPNLDKTIQMLQIFSDLFGLYPFIKEKYGHAQFGKGGMEHQTISSMGVFDEDVIAHELAHQWFGDKITCRDWHHIWLNEGFATYSEALFKEAAYGKESYNSDISFLISRAKLAVGTIYVQNIDIISEIFYGDRSYNKGAVVLHMLRGVTGDSIFFKIIKNYINDPQLSYNSAVTEDFQKIAEETYGASLDYFFNQWIYGENYPKYYLKWNYNHIGNNFYNINVSISQSENTFPKFFTMPLQFKIETYYGDTLITRFNSAQEESFNFIVKGIPVDFIFDPENFILKDIIIEDPAGFRVPPELTLRQNYPNPFNPVTKIGYGISESGNIKIKIYNSLGEELITLVNEFKTPGYYEAEFDGSGFPSGVYIYTISSDKKIQSRKMMLIK